MADRAIYHRLMVAFPPPAVGEFAEIGRGVSVESHDATDKMLACLNHSVRSGPEYQRERNYFDACARWWGELTPEQRETGSVVIDAFTHRHRKGAEGIAGSLPGPRRCFPQRE